MHRYYILKDKTPVAVDLMTWARWLEENPKDRVIEQTYIGKIFVSTVFLGLDHNWAGGEPILYETMVFNHDDEGEYQTRCFTYEEALKMHEAAIRWVKEKTG